MLTVEWSEEEIQHLIDERRSRNVAYHRIFGRSRVAFWNEVIGKINEDLGSNFTGTQCSQKFKSLIRDCKVSVNTKQRDILIVTTNKSKNT